jgi:hypothetical protein
VVRLLWTAAGEPAALATAYLARHVAGKPSGPDAVPPAALAVLPLSGYPDEHAGPVVNEADAKGEGADRAGWRPSATFVELQPPLPAVARSLRLSAGQPAAILTVRFEEPGGRAAALTVAVLRPDLFRVAIEAPAGAPGSFPGSWTHATADWDS